MHDDDLCYCHSGKLYKNCCKIRDIYKPHKRIGYDKKKYLKGWCIDSDYFKSEHYYHWMAEQLLNSVKPKRILDIGCGTGNGIKELLSDTNIRQIISIDDNIECISKTYEEIKKMSSDICVLKRGMENISKDGFYSVDYKEITELPNAKVVIIEGDILIDEVLYGFLSKQKFDAITCWLIGTHLSKNVNLNYTKFDIQDNQSYRLLIENKIYELADIVLTENGVLQIVDRIGYINSEEYENEIKASHEDQASVTSLYINKLDFLEYEPPQNGIPMFRSGIDNKDFENKYAFASVISSRKELVTKI